MSEQKLVEIRIHGRGGQGSVVAAYLIASAAIEDGHFGQAFPSFGPERRGAPVTAFVRVATNPVRRRCQVSHPSFLIIQDETLLHDPAITSGLAPNGGILLNSRRSREQLNLDAALNVVTLPATALAQELLGLPVPNTALAAAFLSLTELFPLAALEKAIGDQFQGDTLERNIRLVREAARRVPAGLWKELSHAAAA